MQTEINKLRSEGAKINGEVQKLLRDLDEFSTITVLDLQDNDTAEVALHKIRRLRKDLSKIADRLETTF